MRLLPGLVPGEAIFMGVDFPVPVSVRVRRPKHPPESDGPQYATGWRIKGTVAADPATVDILGAKAVSGQGTHNL